MPRAAILLCCLLLPAAVPALESQTSSAKSGGLSNGDSTFRANTRIVVLDVSVTDAAGNPVRKLKARDFSVFEDGKQQDIRGFEEHGTDITPSERPVSLNLPPHTYTNYVASQEPGAINILLFDSLNTDRTNLAIARQQLLLYLSQLPRNSRVALFTLDGELHLVHGFTDDPQPLIEAAQQLSTSPHPTLTTARDVSESVAMLAEAGVIKNPAMYRSMTRFLWSEKESKDESRTFITMEALNQLARNMAGFPGRKNLIWISGGLPFDPTSTAPQMQKTVTLLAATQIAVYPIDVRGVAFIGADAATRDSEIFGRNESYDTSSGQNDELISVRETMVAMAKMTGGHAYYNRNDVASAISDGVKAGSNYYILAYRPQNNNWNSKFRKIAVKVSSPSAKVQCRPGYYAVPDPFGSPNIDRTFSLAMQPSAPTSTTLIIKARVLPQEELDKTTQVDILVDVHDLALAGGADHRQAPDVMFVAAAWDMNGKPNGSVSANYRQALSPAELASLMHTGLQVHQEIQLKPGSYQLRLGVVDRLSGKIGTLDVPVTVQEKVAQK